MSDRTKPDDFAQKFRIALDALNWSRTRCSRELGLDKSVVSRWASGGAAPTQDNLSRFTAIIQQSFARFRVSDWRMDTAAFADLLSINTIDAQSAAAPEGPPSIAVLAFDSMSAGPEDNALGDGVVEDIVTELSRSRSLLVTSRASSFAYRGRGLDVKAIARELRVRYVLEGSLRREQDRLRVTAQLIAAEAATHVWAERYDRDLGSAFDLQAEIARTVATAVTAAIADAEALRAVQCPQDDLSAWDMYHQGMWHLAKLEATANDLACARFEHAVALNPLLGAAHIGLAYCYSWAGGLHMTVPIAQAARLASVHARKAVEIDPGDAEALAVLAWTQMFLGEMGNLLRLARQAIAANPNCARAHAVLGLGLIFSGHTAEGREAIGNFERLGPRDPLIAIARRQVIVSYYFDGEYERCIEAGRHLLSTNPELPLNYRWIAAALGQLGRIEEARVALAKSMTVSPREYDVYVRARAPWMRPEDHAHMLEGMRKAGWAG